jgi:hypothetical protein
MLNICVFADSRAKKKLPDGHLVVRTRICHSIDCEWAPDISDSECSFCLWIIPGYTTLLPLSHPLPSSVELQHTDPRFSSPPSSFCCNRASLVDFLCGFAGLPVPFSSAYVCRYTGISSIDMETFVPCFDNFGGNSQPRFVVHGFSADSGGFHHVHGGGGTCSTVGTDSENV